MLLLLLYFCLCLGLPSGLFPSGFLATLYINCERKQFTNCIVAFCCSYQGLMYYLKIQRRCRK